MLAPHIVTVCLCVHSLVWVCGVLWGGVSQDNDLSYLEGIHLFVELLDRYFGNVTELDLVYNFSKVYVALDEYILAGEIQETSQAVILDRLQVLERVWYVPWRAPHVPLCVSVCACPRACHSPRFSALQQLRLLCRCRVCGFTSKK